MEIISEGTTSLLNSLVIQVSQIPNISPEYYKYIKYIPIFAIFFMTALLLKPILGRIAVKLNAIDLPNELRQIKLNEHDQTMGVKAIHKDPTPLLGGLAVIIPVLIAIPLFINTGNIIIPFLIAGAILLAVGLLDDIYNLPAPFQLGGQLVASVIIAFSIVDIPFVNDPFGGLIDLNWFQTEMNALGILWRLIIPGDLLLILWIMLCTNAVKWTGGIGGLLESNMIVAYLLMFILGVRGESAFIAVTAIAMAGGIAGGWIFDFPPAKIFTGSTGKTMYGFIIAVLAVVNGAKVAATIIILALPLMDALYVVVNRYIQFKPKNLIDLMRINGPMHFHHQLYKMNFTPPQILLIETSISIFLGIIAVLTTGAYKFFFLLLIVFILLLLIIILNNKARLQKDSEIKESKDKSPESKYSY